MYVCMSTCNSASSRFLLRGAPDYSADTESEFHAEAHEQLRVKDLPRVPTRRLEVDSNPQPSGCKAPNIPLHHRAPQYTSVSAYMRDVLHWLPASQRISYRIAALVWRCLAGCAPSYLSDLCRPVSDLAPRRA